nr:immunoglobulin heavy chain junction region [Mus musculus]
CARFFYGW